MSHLANLSFLSDKTSTALGGRGTGPETSPKLWDQSHIRDRGPVTDRTDCNLCLQHLSNYSRQSIRRIRARFFVQAAAECGGISLVGSSYDGVGVNDSILSARMAVELIPMLDKNYNLGMSR